jgi:hypothetical protein
MTACAVIPHVSNARREALGYESTSRIAWVGSPLDWLAGHPTVIVLEFVRVT